MAIATLAYNENPTDTGAAKATGPSMPSPADGRMPTPARRTPPTHVYRSRGERADLCCHRGRHDVRPGLSLLAAVWQVRGPLHAGSWLRPTDAVRLRPCRLIKIYFLFAMFDIFFAVTGLLGLKLLQARRPSSS